jgi:Tfp pilus assembly protein PilX
MKRMKQISRHRFGTTRLERGSALFLLLILSVVLATVIAGIFSYITTTARAEKRSNTRLESTYAAEYAFEQAYSQLNTLISQNTINLPSASATSAVTNLSTAPSAVFGATQGYTWQGFITVPVENGAPVSAHSNFNPSQGVYKFITVVEFTRKVAPMPTPVHMQFQREWNYMLTPLFQYAIFYNKDMELFPGAAFNVGGRVHSNGRIYTGTTASITFSDYVTEVNGVTNHYNSPLDPRAEPNLNGPISYSKGVPIVSSAQNPPGELNSDPTDANHNNDGPHELIEVPNSWESDANSGDRMYNKAGLKVLVNSTGSAVTSDSGVSIPANSKVFMTADGTVIPSTDPLATYLSTLMASGSFKDYREGTSVTTIDVDVSQVNTAYSSGGLPETIPTTTKWPNNSSVPGALKNQSIPSALRGKSMWNGVLYVTDVTNSSSHRTGVKLINGSSLPDGTNASSPAAGLTVVTANAAFIVGDYNTGGTPPVDSGTNLAANNFAAGYTVQPAAVIADAVSVVSSSWTSGAYDSKPTLSSRPAANTTINTALISGIVASDGSAYSGGVENYIRLLEDWGGKRLTYYGSMINLYQSQQSMAHWQATGVYYQAPARNWYFDVNFLNPNKLPPGTPILRSLMRGQWVQIE